MVVYAGEPPGAGKSPHLAGKPRFKAAKVAEMAVKTIHVRISRSRGA